MEASEILIAKLIKAKELQQAMKKVERQKHRLDNLSNDVIKKSIQQTFDNVIGIFAISYNQVSNEIKMFEKKEVRY